jgi:tryptophanyl-tRNA synthetase
MGDRERLFGYLEGLGKIILPEPEAKLTKASKMPGLDGQKMSKSYGNTIGLREEPDELDRKIRTMPTDPARVRLTDPGDPEKCPVWELHKVYSDEDTLLWANDACRSAAHGCLACKKPLIDAVQAEMQPIRERAEKFENDRGMVRAIIREGSEAARDVARETLDDVVEAMRFSKQ